MYSKKKSFEYYAHDISRVVAMKGGVVVGPYINASKHIDVICGKGHRFSSNPNNIKNGKWCPVCKKKAKPTIEYVKSIAEERGGECLNDVFTTARDKMRWRCEMGHEWEAPWYSIKVGCWCRKCSRLKHSIETFHEIARMEGGLCLSTEYKYTVKLKFQCKEGHIWETRPQQILKGSWCPYCTRYGRNENKCRDIFEELFGSGFPKARPEFLRMSNKHKMELDGFNESLSIAFEYNGEQHYKEVPIFKSHSLFTRRWKDSWKKKQCELNDVTLIIIPYTIGYHNLKEFIVAECERFGLISKHHL